MTQIAISQPSDAEMDVDDQAINVKIVSSAGDEVFFKVKVTTLLYKVQGAYANKLGKDVNSIRFTYGNNRIQYGATPASLEMEDNDTIDAMVEQVAG